MKQVALGIDIGGTNISVGLVDSTGRILLRKSIPAQAHQGGITLLRRVVNLARSVIKNNNIRLSQKCHCEEQSDEAISHSLHKIKIATLPTVARNDNKELLVGIGACMPGQIDPDKGMPLASTPNIPGWAKLPVKKALSAFGVPVYIENDANTAALGEQTFGVGRGVRNLLFLTLGTGIGGGIIIDGKIYRGSFYYAGEVGHIIVRLPVKLQPTIGGSSSLPLKLPPAVQKNGIKCGCGNYGCLETVASGPSVVRRFLSACLPAEAPVRSLPVRQAGAGGLAQAGHSRPFPSFPRRRESKGVNSSRNPLTAKQVFDLAKRGDKTALSVVRETGYYLGVAIAGFINVLDPEMVIIGGKMSEAGEILMRQIRQNVKGRTMPSKAKCPKIVRAKLGGDAGLIGAAALVFNK